ncbi:hypothetical protein SDC9_199470 [bioreactor metagenome]|uniref:Four helix bundle protein n=1 Tax=bioreactor metagenome TaxID=1076179 RepID=A0A645IKM0_9ZZZZ
MAIDIERLCQNVKMLSNYSCQLRKSASSVFANISEANYGQSKGDMISKFEIDLKKCNETETWLKLLFSAEYIDEDHLKFCVILQEE